MQNNEFNLWLSINWDEIKKAQKEAKKKGFKTFGEVKKYIRKYFKEYGVTFEPSILILSSDSFEKYEKLTN